MTLDQMNEAIAYAQAFAEMTGRATKVVKLSPLLALGMGREVAYTHVSWPLAGEILAVCRPAREAAVA